MKAHKQGILTICLLMALIGITTLYAPLSSEATRIQVTILGGPLGYNLTAQPALDSVQVTGYDQTTNGTLGTLDLKDARGTGSGWSLIVEATDFIHQTDPAKTLAADNLEVPAAPQVIKIAGNTAPESFNGRFDQAFRLLSAAPDTGMGHYQVNAGLALDIPAETFAGTYDSTITLTIVSEAP